MQHKYHYVVKRYIMTYTILASYTFSYDERSTVMMLMRMLDPDSVERRCKHRFKEKSVSK